jgi:hypothetical protein
VGEENFLKKAFLPPHPQLSKTFKKIIFLVLHRMPDFYVSNIERTLLLYIKRLKVLGR